LPLPWLAPKPEPVIVICVPAVAVVGLTELITGADWAHTAADRTVSERVRITREARAR
jgi:hypothetical protein